MKRIGYFVWAVLSLAALGVGLSAESKPAKEVLAEQTYPTPAAFPLRRPGAAEPVVRARYAILLDADSFYALYKKESFVAVPVASTTKMMTALIAEERYDEKEVVTISRQAASQIGSDIDLIAGEKITVLNLLKSLLIQSGNDAAFALAEHSGSLETFVGWMNDQAGQWGLKETSFKDPAGLNDEGRSSAFDLAVLAARLLKNELLSPLVQMAEAEITSADGRRVHKLMNSNRLVTEEMYFPGILGVKTGFTPAAGHTLVAAAERDGHLLISVVLYTHEDTKEASARESSRLLSWGFDNFIWISPGADIR